MTGRLAFWEKSTCYKKPHVKADKDRKIVFTSVTAMRSLWDEMIREGSALAQADVVCLQEHKIAHSVQMDVWQRRFLEKGWIFMGSLAKETTGKEGKRGASGGVGVLFRKHVRVKEFREVSRRFVYCLVEVGMLGTMRVGSAYGNVDNTEKGKEEVMS